jgi:hypothetical protein
MSKDVYSKVSFRNEPIVGWDDTAVIGMYKTNHFNLSFRNEGVVNGNLTIVITYTVNAIESPAFVETCTISCSRNSKGKARFCIFGINNSQVVPNMGFTCSEEEVVFDDKNRISYFNIAEVLHFDYLPCPIREYLKENLFYIMKDAPKK